jgi:hypothetical protein
MWMGFNRFSCDHNKTGYFRSNCIIISNRCLWNRKNIKMNFLFIITFSPGYRTRLFCKVRTVSFSTHWPSCTLIVRYFGISKFGLNILAVRIDCWRTRKDRICKILIEMYINLLDWVVHKSMSVLRANI